MANSTTMARYIPEIVAQSLQTRLHMLNPCRRWDIFDEVFYHLLKQAFEMAMSGKMRLMLRHDLHKGDFALV